MCVSGAIPSDLGITPHPGLPRGDPAALRPGRGAQRRFSSPGQPEIAARADYFAYASADAQPAWKRVSAEQTPNHQVAARVRSPGSGVHSVLLMHGPFPYSRRTNYFLAYAVNIAQPPPLGSLTLRRGKHVEHATGRSFSKYNLCPTSARGRRLRHPLRLPGQHTRTPAAPGRAGPGPHHGRSLAPRHAPTRSDGRRTRGRRDVGRAGLSRSSGRPRLARGVVPQ